MITREDKEEAIVNDMVENWDSASILDYAMNAYQDDLFYFPDEAVDELYEGLGKPK